MNMKDRQERLRQGRRRRRRKSMEIAGLVAPDGEIEQVAKDYEELGYREQFDEASRIAEKEGRPVSYTHLTLPTTPYV